MSDFDTQSASRTATGIVLMLVGLAMFSLLFNVWTSPDHVLAQQFYVQTSSAYLFKGLTGFAFSAMACYLVYRGYAFVHPEEEEE